MDTLPLDKEADGLKAMRQNDQLFRLFIEGVRDYAIFMLDTSGRVASWNAGAELILGYQESEIVGQHFSRFFTPEDVQSGAPERDLETAAAEGEFKAERWHVRQDGTYFYASDLTTVLRGSQMQGFVKVMRDVTERRMADERILHKAFHDTLTGLPNRALFLDHLRRLIARVKRHADYQFAVLFLDLDRFKIINDSLGHVIGDQLLVATARKLELCLRPEDVVARFGGDEFTILLEDVKDVADATGVADRIHQQLKLPFNLNGYEVSTTASIGIALSGRAYEQPEDILCDADTAMYRAKERGRACHELFDPRMHVSAVRLVSLETDLRQALERNEFLLHYQPIVELATDQVTGFEALLRWRHPERGLISPTEFIPVAEESGLMIEIGRWTLLEACRQLRAWREQAGRQLPLAMSVNLSSKQFLQPDLTEQISDVLARTHLEACNLKLEITEGVIMEQAEVTAAFKRLRALGVKLHVDDFGTGRSSLRSLHRIPVDVLKIDRSFVSDRNSLIESPEIVRTIVQLAHNLGMEVIAEGVETRTQLDELRTLGCEYGQGFLFSRPVDGNAARELLARNQ